MVKLNWTFEAETWLRDIHDYIAKENRNAAANVVSEIYKKAQSLRTFPGIGYKYGVEKEGEIRILLYGHYRIAYLIKSKTEIDVLGVFHGALDIERYL
jgi:plasmid stabilization system protein ParE